MKHLFTLLALVAFAASGWAQNTSHRCGTMEVHEHLMNTNPEYAQRRNVVAQHTRDYEETGSLHSAQRVVYTIPVVFHVVYQNATENISEAQLLSQIDVLNEDFRKLNANFNQTPAAFQGVSADFEIEFCLATTDPNGAPTNGITRTQTTVGSFGTNDDVKFNSSGGKNAWPSTKYLNFWVADLGNSLLGYAQFPGGPANTDGVVCTYTSVGRPPANPFNNEFNLGRTATHEIGHWLNLYHIWGNEESGCGNSPGSAGTDEVSDTPVQDDATAGCPNFPQISCNNGPNGDMFMNYMDYMYDDCATMFTSGQKTRSRALFNVGGERYSLLTANVCSVAPPTPGTACNDTLRFPLVGTEVIYGDANQGYMAGTNVYLDREKAEKFTAVAPYTRVKGGLYKFAVANANGVNNHNVTFKLYDDNGAGGLPGTVLATTSLPLSTITTSVNNDSYLQVTFPTPVTVSGSFYLSYTVSPETAVEISLYTNTIGDVTVNTAFELFDDNTWHAFSEAQPVSWGVSVNQTISAWMETIPPTVSFSVNDNSICAGTSVTFTSTTSNSTGIQWNFPGGSPSNSTQANPTITYNSAGSYNATLIATGACAAQTVTQAQANFIVVTAQPSTPVISNNNGTLSLGSVSGSVQWFVNNTPISGANGVSHTPSSIGNYTATVTLNGCVSTSAPFPVNSVGIQNIGLGQTVVFPNPANDHFMIQLGAVQAETFTVILTDLSGKEVIRKSFNNLASGASLEISTSDLAIGMYQLLMFNNNEKQVVKIAVSR